METTVNQRIKILRDSLKMSQGELGTKIGVTQTSIQRLESSQINLTNKMIRKFCEGLGVNENWLLEGEGEMLKSETPKERQESKGISNLQQLREDLAVLYGVIVGKLGEEVAKELRPYFPKFKVSPSVQV